MASWRSRPKPGAKRISATPKEAIRRVHEVMVPRIAIVALLIEDAATVINLALGIPDVRQIVYAMLTSV